MAYLNKSIKFSLFFLCLLVMAGFDIWFDFQNGIPVRYLLFETSIFFVCLVGFNFFLTKSLEGHSQQKQLIRSLKNQVDEKNSRLSTLNQKVLSYKEAFSNEIEQTFKQWKLTRAESEIAGLLLKGLSLKEIASIRTSNENTVRSQCTSIYKKSNLSNRSQLSSYFLDDLV